MRDLVLGDLASIESLRQGDFLSDVPLMLSLEVRKILLALDERLLKLEAGNDNDTENRNPPRIS